MNANVREKLDMFGQVRVFSLAHPSTEPTYVLVLKRLTESLERADAIAEKQKTGTVKSRVARNRRRELRRDLHFGLLRYLVAAGSMAARDRAELEEQFKLPSAKISNAGFLTSVKALVSGAGAQKETLVAAGMAPQLLDELGARITDFEQAVDEARAGRQDHVGARAELTELTAELMDEVNVLDGINRWRYAKDPELLAEWSSARHVVRHRTRAKAGDAGPEKAEPAA